MRLCVRVHVCMHVCSTLWAGRMGREVCLAPCVLLRADGICSVLQSPPKANDSSTQALGSGEGVCFPWASSMVHPTKTAPGAPSWSLATRPPRALNPVPSLPLGQAAGSQEATTFPESHPHPPCLLSLFPQQLDWPHSLARAVSVNQFQTSRAAFPWPREGCVGGSLFLTRAFSS